jgi:class 3 adenylate cyclase/tetratricopeptide (TPR) repeat protein
MSSSVTATFVFTDLVDSTATAARLGPEAAEELRQSHFRLLRGSVSASGGVEVKNLGDGLMVMYSSLSRALAGAVGMQQAIDHHNRSGGEQLGVRIGISAGEAIEEDGDFFGEAVVEAARLCAAAAAGQILAAELVRSLVGRHATQTFVEVGALNLKGLPEAVAAVEVLWEPAKVEGAVPLPGRLVGAASDALFGFFGRGPELAALEEARKHAHGSQRCQVVFVAGEAGMGKTALVAQAARAAHDAGAVVLFGHADEGFGIAYQPWIEIVTTVVRDCAPAFVTGLRQAQRGALARLVPEIGGGERVIDPDTERLLLLEGSTELLAAVSRDAPVLVVLDDLHWADAASLQLLRHLVGSTTPMEVTVACTYRDTDLARGDPLNVLLTDLHREANVTRIPLSGLEDTELIDLLEAAAGHALDDSGVGLAHSLRRETDGNPFFAGEILRHLGESGQIVLGENGRWTVAVELEDLGLPNSVRDVIGRRVERLGDQAARVLRLAAVIGREFDVTTLVALVDLDEDSVLDLLDAAVAAAVLTESAVADRYRFAHALIQHSLYDELSPTRRQRAHQRIAEDLEARALLEGVMSFAELAHHWVAATKPTDLDKALNYLRRAGDEARDALAPDDAIRWYQQALELLDRRTIPDEHQRAELLAALGAVQHQAGNPEYRDTLRHAAALAERLDDSDVLVQTALAFARTGMAGDEDIKRVAAAALVRIGPDAIATRARVLAVLAAGHDASLEWKVRRELSFQALDAARQSDDATFVAVIDTAIMTLTTPDRLVHNVADLERAIALADRLADPVQQLETRSWLVALRYQQCDVAGADRLIAEMEVLGERVGLGWQRHVVAIAEVAQLLLAGRVDEAEAANEHALEVGTAAGVPSASSQYASLLSNIRRHQGRLGEIVDFFVDVARDDPSIAALRAAVPAMLCEVGRTDEAHTRLAAEAATDFEFPYDQTWLLCMCRLLDAAVTTADRNAAETLVERIAPYSTQVAAAPSVVLGAVDRPLARAATLLGDYSQAEQRFAAAHDIHVRLQAPFYVALTQLDHADLCLTRHSNGDLERATQLATSAAATAAEYGCAGLTNRAAALLAAI